MAFIKGLVETKMESENVFIVNWFAFLCFPSSGFPEYKSYAHKNDFDLVWYHTYTWYSKFLGWHPWDYEYHFCVYVIHPHG